MTLRDKLLANKPQLTPIEINGETYYLRTMTVGDMNRQVFEFRNWLIEQAELAGVELPNEDDGFDEALDRFGAKYRLPQSIAARLCDENGKLLFDPQSLDDLNAIAALDSQVIIDFNQAVSPPKASASEESSS